MESTLRLCGYSVSQQEGLATSERQTLLAKIMKLGVVSKSDIIRYLNYFIAFNGRKAGNELAVDKWESDLCFVRSHEIDSQESVKISDIRRH